MSQARSIRRSAFLEQEQRQEATGLGWLLVGCVDWKNKQQKHHSQYLLHFQAEGRNSIEEGATGRHQCYREGILGWAAGWSFSSKIPATAQQSSPRRKCYKGELTSCLAVMIRFVLRAQPGQWRAFEKWCDPALTPKPAGRQRAMPVRLWQLPAPAFNTARGLPPGIPGWGCRKQ